MAHGGRPFVLEVVAACALADLGAFSDARDLLWDAWLEGKDVSAYPRKALPATFADRRALELCGRDFDHAERILRQLDAFLVEDPKALFRCCEILAHTATGGPTDGLLFDTFLRLAQQDPPRMVPQAVGMLCMRRGLWGSGPGEGILEWLRQQPFRQVVAAVHWMPPWVGDVDDDVVEALLEALRD